MALYVVNAPPHAPYWWERNGTGIPPSGVAPITIAATIPAAPPPGAGVSGFIQRNMVVLLIAAGCVWLLSGSGSTRRH